MLVNCIITPLLKLTYLDHSFIKYFLLLLIAFNLGSFNAMSQENCDKDWVKRKGIKSATLKTNHIIPQKRRTEIYTFYENGQLKQYNCDSLYGSVISKYDEQGRIISEIVIHLADVELEQADPELSNKDTSYLFAEIYDSLNQLSSLTYRFFRFKENGDREIDNSSHTTYEYQKGLKTEVEEEIESSDTTIWTERIYLNQNANDSIRYCILSYDQEPLDTFNRKKFFYDEFDRLNSTVVNRDITIESTKIYYRGQSDFIREKQFERAREDGHLMVTYFTKYRFRSHEIKEITTVNYPNGKIDKRKIKRYRPNCNSGLKYEFKHLNIEEAELTFKYY